MYTEEKYNDIDKLIASYLSNELDEKSFSELKRWSMESETNRIYVRDQLEIWFSSGVLSDKTFFNKNEAFDLFKQRVAEAGRNKRLRRFSWKVIYRVAAVVLLLLLPLATYWQGKEVVKHNFADMVVEAPLGARTKLYLPDGTLVWLNAGSKIVYSQGFGVDDRNLSLEGEGYFEVTKNAQKPFEVQVGDASIKVLGTIFNVEAIEDDEYITATLIKGSIRFESPKQQVILSPNQQLRFEKSTQQIDVSSVDTDLEIAWKNDLLKYKSISFVSLLKDLEKRYNVKFTILNKKLTDPAVTLSGTFTQEQSLEQILQVINKSLPIKWSYKEGVYYIK